MSSGRPPWSRAGAPRWRATMSDLDQDGEPIDDEREHQRQGAEHASATPGAPRRGWPGATPGTAGTAEPDGDGRAQDGSRRACPVGRRCRCRPTGPSHRCPVDSATLLASPPFPASCGRPFHGRPPLGAAVTASPKPSTPTTSPPPSPTSTRPSPAKRRGFVFPSSEIYGGDQRRVGLRTPRRGAQEQREAGLVAGDGPGA